MKLVGGYLLGVLLYFIASSLFRDHVAWTGLFEFLLVSIFVFPFLYFIIQGRHSSD
ncbi:hypothetical protein [Halobacillus salinus]|uniref:hypothetical protein n=1 Tax=Halobacillus salinus TaxID=192814 RepID=UPI0013050CA3|nr:hypothetical protein [Halobacillus salinus]